MIKWSIEPAMWWSRPILCIKCVVRFASGNAVLVFTDVGSIVECYNVKDVNLEQEHDTRKIKRGEDYEHT
jgi:hypothetical protein